MRIYRCLLASLPGLLILVPVELRAEEPVVSSEPLAVSCELLTTARAQSSIANFQSPISNPQLEISTTGPHRFWITNRDADGDRQLGEWIMAQDLQPGDRVRLANGRQAVLEEVEEEVVSREPLVTSASQSQPQTTLPLTTSHEPRFTTYNFEVADFNTYFVGRDGVWVHNTCLTYRDVKYIIDEPNAPAHIVHWMDRIGASRSPHAPGKGWFHWEFHGHLIDTPGKPLWESTLKGKKYREEWLKEFVRRVNTIDDLHKAKQKGRPRFDPDRYRNIDDVIEDIDDEF